MKHGFTPGCRGCEAVQAGTPPRGHTEPCRMRIETAMRGDKDGGEARVARAEIARAVASGSGMEIDTDIAPPLAAPAEPPPSSARPLLGAETPSIGASSSRKRTAAEGGDETVTAMADSRGNPFQAVEMLELCAEHEQATGVLCSVNLLRFTIRSASRNHLIHSNSHTGESLMCVMVGTSAMQGSGIGVGLCSRS